MVLFTLSKRPYFMRRIVIVIVGLIIAAILITQQIDTFQHHISKLWANAPDVEKCQGGNCKDENSVVKSASRIFNMARNMVDAVSQETAVDQKLYPSTSPIPTSSSSTTTTTTTTATTKTTNIPPATTQTGQNISSEQLREQMNSQLRYFKVLKGQDTFLYSAIANFREPKEGQLNIIVSVMDSTNADQLNCCVYLQNKTLVQTTGTLYYSKGRAAGSQPNVQRQYNCAIHENLNASFVTLTSSSCATPTDDYLPVVYPKVVPGGLAICAKATFGTELDPNKLMEWFEVQRLLGVDHIQIMDLHNPEPIQKVFRYYVNMGLLDLLPYELPGRPYGRGLHESNRVFKQFSHDDGFSVMDCRQRLAGYTYIMGIDVDEILIPAKQQDVKTFVKEQLAIHPDAAGFFFNTQFFLYEWGPTNNDSDISVFRFVNSTFPRMECYKYVYVTERVTQAATHSIKRKSPYKQYTVPADVAILHHYRQCPRGWKTCNEPKKTDRSILRFKGVLEERLKSARTATGISP